MIGIGIIFGFYDKEVFISLYCIVVDCYVNVKGFYEIGIILGFYDLEFLQICVEFGLDSCVFWMINLDDKLVFFCCF